MVWLEVKVTAALDIRESVRVVGTDWSHQREMTKWCRSGETVGSWGTEAERGGKGCRGWDFGAGVERNLDDRKAVVCEGDT